MVWTTRSKFDHSLSYVEVSLRLDEEEDSELVSHAWSSEPTTENGITGHRLLCGTASGLLVGCIVPPPSSNADEVVRH